MGQTVSIVNETNVFLHVSFKHIGPVFYTNYLAPGQRWSREIPKGWYTIEAKLALSNNEYDKSQVYKPIIACTAAGIVIVGVAGAAAFAAPTAAAATIVGGETAGVVAATGSVAGSTTAAAATATAAAASTSSATATAAAASATVARTVATRVATFVSAKKITLLKNVATFAVPSVITAFTNRPTVQSDELRQHQERLNKISLFKMGVTINKKTNRFIIRGGPPSDQVTIHPDLVQEIIIDPDFPELDLVIISDAPDGNDEDLLREEIELTTSMNQLTTN